MLKMKPFTNVLVAGLLLCFSQLFAQMTTTLSPQTISGAIGTTVDLQLKVTNFTNVITFQAPIIYSNTVLQYLSADGFGLPGMSAANVSNPASGTPRVVVSYFPDPIAYPSGVTVANATSIITLHFKVIANGTATVNLATGVPPGIEVINSAGNNITVNFQTGGTTVTGGSGGSAPLIGFKIIASPDTVSVGETFCLPIKVNDFDKITLFQYAMHWDPTVLEYQSVTGFNLPDLTASNFSGNATMGVKTVSWFDMSPNLSGVDRPDLATIYNVCFKAIGANNTFTNLYFDGIGFPAGSGGSEAYSALNITPVNLFTNATSVPALVRIINSANPPVTAPKIIVDTTSTNINTIKCVDVRVKTFTDVASLQFGLTYDATKLTYQNVQLGTNPLGLLATDITSTTAGEVRFVWNANLTANPQGVDLVDNASIFQACFLATGAVGTVNNIVPAALATLPLKAQIRVGSTNVDATPTTQNGYIRIKSAPPANALTFTIDTATTLLGTSICLTVKVKNFTGIESLQFGITYDQTKLQWQAPNLGANPLGLSPSVFNNNSNTGQVRFSWSAPDPVGMPSFTVPDGTTIFSLCFLANSGSGMTVPINIQSLNNLTIEISQITNNMSHFITPFIQNGSITITTLVPQVTVDSTKNVKCNGAADGAIYITAKNGTATAYSWSGPNSYTSTQADITGLRAGDYTVIVTYTGGTTVTKTITITQPTAMSLPVVTPSSVTCFGGNTGSITVGPAGGTTPYSYKWASSVSGFTTSNAASISNLRAGNYTITVTDANNCTIASGQILVSQPNQITVPTSAATITQVSCTGVSNGAITVVPSGGTAPFNYVWTGPTGTPTFVSTNAATISNLRVGNYTVTATDASGCTGASAALAVTAGANPISLPTANINITGVACSGGNTGKIVITPVGGATPYSFIWSGPGGFTTSNSAMISNLSTGNYKVTITDANSCSFVSNAILVPNTSNNIVIPTSSLMVDQIKCNGGTGTISLTPTGGVPYSAPSSAYNYNWSGPNNTTYNQAPPLTGLPAGLYRVTVTDSQGCTGALSSPIQINPAPPAMAADLTDTDNVKCLNDQNGAIQIQVVGGTTPYSFVWRNTATNAIAAVVQNPTNLPSGTFVPVITDGNGCTTSLNPVTINKPTAALTASLASKIDVKCHNGNNGIIEINTTGGWGSNTIAWTPPGNVGTTITGLVAGTYTPTITDAGGCVVSTQSITITEPSAISVATTSVTNVKCFGQGDGSISINVQGGSPTYNVNWTPGGLSGTTISNLAGGTYTPTISDANNCTMVGAPITVTEAQPIVLGAPVIVSQIGSLLGSITMNVSGGTGAYSYKWSHLTGATANPTVSGLTAATYSVTVTDANQCSRVESYVVTNSNILTASFIDKSAACGSVGGCVRLFVQPVSSVNNRPYKFTWSPNGSYTENNINLDTISICNLQNGVYSFTVTDALGNVFPITTQVGIQNYAPVAVNSTVTNSIRDQSTGSIQVNPIVATSQYTYLWNFQNLTTNFIGSLDSGIYKVTITDITSGCTTVETFHIVRKWEPLVVNHVDEKPTCTASENGKITVLVNGGNDPYDFNWAGPSISSDDTTNIITNLKQGLYGLTITDENGTTSTLQITIVSKSNLTATALNVPGANGWDVSGAGICDGEVQITTPSGYVAPLSYTWNNSATTAINETLCEGPWNAVVTDAEGCTVALNGTLTAPGAIAIVSSCVDKNGYCVTCHGDSDGVAKVSALGGIAPYQVEWSTGFTQTLANSTQESVQPGLKAGDYKVTITDANGVKSIKTVTVTEPEPLQVVFTTEKPTRFTNCDAFTVANLAGGSTGAATFTWSTKFNSGTGPQVEGLCAGEVVSFLVQDANGCRTTAKDTVDFPDDGCLIFRPVLTPSQKDEKNDYLLITCVEFVPNNTLEVYNRWGQSVFQTESYNNDSNNWTGTNIRNEPLPEGVYFYVFKYKNDTTGENVEKKGYINILR
jgi:gliding motility-associated-like protein